MKQLRQTLYIMTPERYLSLDGENVDGSGEENRFSTSAAA